MTETTQLTSSDVIDIHELIDCSDAMLIEALREKEWPRCASDVCYFVDNYCMTYDPRLLSVGKSAKLPFKLFDKQREFMLWIDAKMSARESGLVEKSRDMGITWCCAAFALHGLLFKPGFSAGFGSRKLDLVDRKDDIDSILEKVRFMYRNLPEYLKSEAYQEAYCRINNGEASITGEGGDDIGRGGRKSVYFVDESAYIERYERVEAALSQNTETVIDISTHNGVGTRFYQKRNEGKVDVFVFDWRDDPRKDQAWYEAKKLSLPANIVAQEIDRDPTASLTDSVIKTAWIRAAVDLDLAQLAARQGKEWSEATLVEAGLDVADGGEDSSVYISRKGAVVHRLEYWRSNNTTNTANKAAEFARQDGAEILKYDKVGVGAGVAATFELNKKTLGFVAHGIGGADAPSEKMAFDDVPNVWINERFVNKRAENWWNLRRRFQRTYEHVSGIREYPLDELISIPNHNVLINELTTVLMKYTESGKIKIESKADMKKRGVKSPDYADALVYCFAFVKKRYIGFI